MNRRRIILSIAILAILLGGVAAGVLLLSPDQTVFHRVTFRDFDGRVLKTETVEAGKAATAPADPVREGYVFLRWNKDYSSVVKDTIITAEYLRITKTAFTVDTVTAAADRRQVEVAIYVTDNPGILGMVFSVNYDDEALKLIDCQNGVALSSLAFQAPSRFSSGCNFVWYGSQTGEVTDGEMLILTFEIAENASPGTYPVSISWKENTIYDSNSDMVDPSVKQGAIVVS